MLAVLLVAVIQLLVSPAYADSGDLLSSQGEDFGLEEIVDEGSPVSPDSSAGSPSGDLGSGGEGRRPLAGRASRPSAGRGRRRGPRPILRTSRPLTRRGGRPLRRIRPRPLGTAGWRSTGCGTTTRAASPSGGRCYSGALGTGSTPRGAAPWRRASSASTARGTATAPTAGWLPAGTPTAAGPTTTTRSTAP